MLHKILSRLDVSKWSEVVMSNAHLDNDRTNTQQNENGRNFMHLLLMRPEIHLSEQSLLKLCKLVHNTNPSIWHAR